MGDIIVKPGTNIHDQHYFDWPKAAQVAFIVLKALKKLTKAKVTSYQIKNVMNVFIKGGYLASDGFVTSCLQHPELKGKFDGISDELKNKGVTRLEHSGSTFFNVIRN